MQIDYEKCGGLVPAIIQDAVTKNVLMLGYMNQEAFDNTGLDYFESADAWLYERGIAGKNAGDKEGDVLEPLT